MVAKKASKKSLRTQLEVLVFKDGPGSFALPLHEIKEIVNLRRIIELPFAAPLLIGLVNLRGMVVPLVSPYRLQSGRGRYLNEVEYASVIEAAGVDVAVACQKIFGVKSVELDPKDEAKLIRLVTIDGKRVKLLDPSLFIRTASESLLDERFGVAP